MGGAEIMTMTKPVLSRMMSRELWPASPRLINMWRINDILNEPPLHLEAPDEYLWNWFHAGELAPAEC